MPNDLSTLPAAFGASAAALAALDPNWNPQGNSEFSGGIRRGYAIISLKGKTWKTTYQGVERVVTRPDDGTPAAALQVVIIAATADLAKVYYKNEYVEGSDASPDCFSNDGIKPDRTVAAPVHPNCAACPMNVWGAKVTAQGKNTKPCSDSKRLALLPLPQAGVVGDDALDALDNEALGGAMMLRLPAASLTELAQYDTMMRSAGFPIYALGTTLVFDTDAAFPRVMFKPVRPLTPDEFAVVIEHRDSIAVREMLGITQVGAPAIAGAASQAALPAPAAVDPAVAAHAAAQAAAQAAQAAEAERVRLAEAERVRLAAEALKVQQAAHAAAQAAAQAAAATGAGAGAPAPAAGRRARRAAVPDATPAAAPAAAVPEATIVTAPAAVAPMAAAPAAVAPSITAATIDDLDDVLAGVLSNA